MAVFSFLLLLALAAVALLLFAGRYWWRRINKGQTNSTDLQRSALAMKVSLQTSLTKRFAAIALLGLSMSIPLAFVENVVEERDVYYHSVVDDIARLWGREQVLMGPLLVLPFVEKFVTEEAIRNDSGNSETKSKINYRNRQAVFLPNELFIDANISEDYRKRAIYESLVYAAKINVHARFPRPDVSTLSAHLHRIEWAKAKIVFGVSDTKSIDTISRLQFDGMDTRLAAGTQLGDHIASGFHAVIDKLDPALASHELELDLDLNGSRGFRFAPFGETTKATIRSSWPHPSFAGNVLPDEHEISDQGFTASWTIPHLARNYPQAWVLDQTTVNPHELLAGVDLFEPVTVYSRITRAVKYGLLIVALTYLTFLVFELSTGSALHIVQYGLIGAALALFYLMLLSLSEHIGFASAYIAATCLSVGLISIYVGTATPSRARGLFLFVLLAALYGLLYALLQMEDYALLVGSFVLAAVLALLMYLTRGLKVASPPARKAGSNDNERAQSV